MPYHSEQQNDAHQTATTFAAAQHQLDFFPQEDSPTVGRKTYQHSPNNSLPAAGDSQYRYQRKAAPSPLVYSSTAITTSPPGSVTPTRTTFPRTAAGHTNFSTGISESPDEFPEQQLDSQKSFYQSEDSSTEALPHFDHNSSRTVLNDPNAASRSVSDPVLTSKPTSRPMAATAPIHRKDIGRPLPRQSSIDSAISSMSDGALQKPGSRPGSAINDIENLIRTAGSAEAVIQYLLKEKQSQAAQNSQLWRLVDKQRAMILGLNKDLERSLKDKERYRKKLKENLGMVSAPSPIESTQGELGSENGSVASHSRAAEAPRPANVEALVSAGLREPEHDHPPSPIDVALAPYPITPPANHDIASPLPTLTNMTEAEHRMPSPTAHAFQQYDADAHVPGFEEGQLQRKASMAQGVPYKATLPPSRTFTNNPPPKGPPPALPPPKAPMSSQNNFSLAITEASPEVDHGLAKFPTPRKAPPAPLKLGMRNETSSHLHGVGDGGNETDSDYDDILEVDEIPVFPERGRRKTREEDDRDREAAAQKDAELRSLSKKSSGSTPKSRPTTPKDVDPMPASPRTVPISPPNMFSDAANAGSLAGMLSANSQGSIAGPLSPGLPLSPRPADRAMASPLPKNPREATSGSAVNSPPMSPRSTGAFPAAPLSPRAPRQPIPLPPGTPMSISSPREVRGDPLQLVSPKPLLIQKRAEASTGSPKDQSPNSPQMRTSSAEGRPGIFKGFVTEEYPDLLLPPNALPSIDVKVASSRLKPSRASIMFPKTYDEDPVFTLAVFSRSDGKELWRCEKDSSSLAQLDQFLKQSPNFTAKTPEKSLFTGHAPAKLDARRVALDRYLDEVLNTPMEQPYALELCRYLSANAMEPNAENLHLVGDSISESPVKTGPGGRTYKNGYLTKRGKNFGGWKARFFVLDGPVFRYFESPGGPHLGTIKLQNAQIGKQQQSTESQSPSRGDSGEDQDNQYRHAFLILEPKRKDSSSLVRHVLCAESDQERDQWVEALLQWVDFRDEEEKRSNSRQHARNDSNGSGHGVTSRKKASGTGRSHTVPERDDLRGVSYETTKQGNAPRRTKNTDTPSPPTHGHEQDPMSRAQPQASKAISAPKNAHVIQDSTSWGNKSNMLAPAVADDRIKQKKRSFFGFGAKPRSPYDSSDAGGGDSTNLSQLAYEQHGPIRPVFGAPLSEAVKYNHPANVQIELPAVIYRCIEYLDAKNAASEEGIFRLSGSNVVIKQLRERFNTEGDLNLVTDEQYYDIHAVASLLKLYLRELPSTILTRELHLEFLAVTELGSIEEKVRACNGLIHRLPRANISLLRYLASFLINIINHADVNKMTVRNVGIVFSPTLNIPAPVFALFLQQYEGIFDAIPEGQEIVEVSVNAPPLAPNDIRSPRRQKFQDLPTPSYDNSPYGPPPNFPPPQHYQQQRTGYDTGFTSLQPSYEPQLQTMAGPEYGSRAPTLAGPSYDVYSGGKPYGRESPAPKSKRRESTMFGMGMGMSKKASSQKLREEREYIA
ncbi:hypothetical protein BP5796_10685 [Coleophoma crateriformis]|uniref:RhoGAP-domain-containing protein n=1 Tax=Coleophoma crateriformis TaxID=565419 RepID=A0A3D8QQU0_9HELO|nr:hypothetical protein BP5796_10685 [Coleophoma crateriformis]